MITIDDYLRDMSPRQQVEALRSCLLSTERERDELREEVARLEMWQRIANERSAEIVRLRTALDEGQTHSACPKCPDGRCHCHACVMALLQERDEAIQHRDDYENLVIDRSLKIQALCKERDEAREAGRATGDAGPLAVAGGGDKG